MPHEYQAFLGRLYELVPGLRDVVLSVHCHDDLGLAVANSFAGLQAGARQVECAINGIGERAGNASLEEIVMLLHTRAADVGLRTGINTREIARTSRLVSRLTGYPVQPNKAIVGRNAFAHESGIHQDGVLKERSTYEIMDATTVGLEANSLVLGKHSGRHALKSALEELGYDVAGQTLNTAFKRFKEIADKKKQVTAMDLEALVTDELRDDMRAYTLEWFDVEASTRRPPHATVELRTPDGEVVRGDFTGDGPVDAIFRAINAATKREARLREFRIDSVTGGQDALGEASVVLELAGQSAAGQGVSTDIIEAAALAYVRALSNAERRVLAAAETAGRGGRAGAQPDAVAMLRQLGLGERGPGGVGGERPSPRRTRGLADRPRGAAPGRRPGARGLRRRGRRTTSRGGRSSTPLALGAGDRLLELGLRRRAAAARRAGDRRRRDRARPQRGDGRARARARPGAEVVLGGAEALPFADGAFSAAAMSIVLMFLPDPVAALRECRRVLDADWAARRLHERAGAARHAGGAGADRVARALLRGRRAGRAGGARRASRASRWPTRTAGSC